MLGGRTSSRTLAEPNCHERAIPCQATEPGPVFLHPTLPLHPQEVNKAQAATRARLDTEYRRLVDNLVEAQQLRGGEEWLSNPTLPEDVVQESMPGGAAVLGCWVALGSASCVVKRLKK